MRDLELLAPARNVDIGIAAIDCGADAVYIAGPAFGARAAAGNPMEDIARLCAYARRFGVRIYLTLNTILYNDERAAARDLLVAARDAGVDAVIVQDLAVPELARQAGVTLPLHASTQFAIRSPERARYAESLGFSRIVPERQLSLEEIRAIRAAVGTEIECFVHGALCVCYSGQCYLSEYLSGRSANRGACSQACRSRYDLVDGDGRVLVRNKALLSLKDLRLIHRLGELADAGVCSFKIEGRLKNKSYVRNVVRAYSAALDALVAARPGTYRRASFGRVEGGPAPELDKTFNRGYTELYLDGKRGRWAAMDIPKSAGERIGTLERILPDGSLLVRAERPGLSLHNGDGFAYIESGGDVVGFRGDVCEGLVIRTGHPVGGLVAGTVLYRNFDADFERRLDRQAPTRSLSARISLRTTPEGLVARAESEDGRLAEASAPAAGPAGNPARMADSLRSQLEKRSGEFSFTLGDVCNEGPLPFLPVSVLNGLRRSLSEALGAQPCRKRPASVPGSLSPALSPAPPSYKDNLANDTARAVARAAGDAETAYELSHRPGVELMRSKYCIRAELGLCLREAATKARGPLYLRNNGRLLPLRFDCAACEMAVLDA